MPMAYGISDDNFDTKMTVFNPSAGIIGGILYSLVLTKYPKKMMLGAYTINIGLIFSWAFFYYVDT